MQNEYFDLYILELRTILSITADDLRDKFSEWLISKFQDPADKAMMRYYSSDIVIRTFLGDPDFPGMGATYKEQIYPAIRASLVTIFEEQLRAHTLPQVSTIYVAGKTIVIEHVGEGADNFSAWHEIIRGLSEDLAQGHGTYPLAEGRAVAKWKQIS